MPLSASFKSAVGHYLYGLFASSLNGAMSAVAAIIGIDGVSITGLDTIALPAGQQTARVLNVHEMVSCFVGAFVLHAFLFFKAHPIPETYGTRPPILPKS